MPIFTRHRRAIAAALAVCVLSLPALGQDNASAPQSIALRVATFNIEDLRTAELKGEPSDRVRAAAQIIQRIRPNVILINEIAYDMPGGPGYEEGDPPGRNGARFAEILATPQGPGLAPLKMTAFMEPVNTGRASGFDLDRSGEAVTSIPPLDADEETKRAYGNDAWGYGTFPGQYGMALLVDDRLEIERRFIRTFRLFPWMFMPNALMPTRTNEEGETEPWYPEDARELFRLSSKSHWDVPIRLPSGELLHVLCSHPTPPAFDGPEQRNKRRNHDEIRFWGDYIDDADYIIDDERRPGGLPASAHFVIVGDLNADPDEGGDIRDPIGSFLFNSSHTAPDPRPVADVSVEDLDADDTAVFGLRVDYVLPSDSIATLRSGVWRRAPSEGEFPSDHFPVWADLAIPAPDGETP